MSNQIEGDALKRVATVATGIAKDLPPVPVSIAGWSTGVDVTKVVSALQEFSECVRYLNNRRSKGTVIDIKSEADVQDAIYLMLRPWIHDLIWENPTDKVGSRYAIKDFLSKELNLVVEAKYVRDKKHGKGITAELHDDIETYRYHPHCRTIVFFIYDPDTHIPDVPSLKKHIESKRVYDGRQLTAYCIVKP